MMELYKYVGKAKKTVGGYVMVQDKPKWMLNLCLIFHYFPVKKNNFKRRLVAEYKKHKINIRLNYFDKKLYSIHNNSTNELISDLFVRTFDDLAVIKNTTRRKIQLIICAKIHKTTPAIAEEIIENNGLFYAIPIDKKLLNSIRGFLN